MKRLALIVAFALVGCGPTYNPLTLEQLEHYPLDCNKRDGQLKSLTDLQKYKNFAQDPDQLDEDSRAYNAALKKNIWWLRENCQ